MESFSKARNTKLNCSRDNVARNSSAVIVKERNLLRLENGDDSNLLETENVDDMKYCGYDLCKAISSVDRAAGFDIPAHRCSKTCIYGAHQSRSCSKRKCIDWMSQIPEEVSPSLVVRSTSKFELSFQQRKRWHTHDDTHDSYIINGKKLFKSKSDLTGRIKDQMDLNFRLDEELPCNKLMKTTLTVSKAEIQSTVLKVLEGIGEEKLDILLQSVESGDVNTDDVSIGININNTVNIVPECEQRFIRSPHPNRKYEVNRKVMGHIEENYMKLKTDVFSASTEEKDNHVGEIDICIQYLIVTKRLKTTIETLKIPNYKEACKVFVNVSLEEGMSRKRGKQTKHVRGSKRYITYNESIFFENVDIANVHLHCLRIQVFKKPLFFINKNKCIGECFVYLDNCDVVGKVKVCKGLIPCE